MTDRVGLHAMGTVQWLLMCQQNRVAPYASRHAAFAHSYEYMVPLFHLDNTLMRHDRPYAFELRYAHGRYEGAPAI